MKLKGTVKNITDYGAFIDLGNMDGLVHITDISWKRINHPAEALKIGQIVDVVVIDITPIGENNKRISLGIKQADDSPWKKIKEEFPIGKIINSKITSITDYGVFVELKDGIDGLIHSSQLSWNKIYPKDIRNKYKIGEMIKCSIVSIDDTKYRISLGAKQFFAKPCEDFIKQHPVGSTVIKPIKSIASFGLFVQLSDEVVGLVHESDIPEDGRGSNIFHKYKNGQMLECRVLNYKSEKGHINLRVAELYKKDQKKEEEINAKEEN